MSKHQQKNCSIRTTPRFIYPYDISRKVKEENLGVLAEITQNVYSFQEMNQIVARLIVRTPYVAGAMLVSFNFYQVGAGDHSRLIFKNPYYNEQEKGDLCVRYLFDDNGDLLDGSDSH